MSVGVQAFQGSRLTEARRACAFSKKDLADKIGVSGTAIANYEGGRDRPQHDRLCALANELRFPYEFFLRPSWGEAIDLVFWRSRAAETKTARVMTEQRMRWLCETFAFLESDLTFPHHALPRLDIPDDFRLITGEVIERAAEALRADWKLGPRPIPDVMLALENVGIPVASLDIRSDKQDGFCFRSAYLGRPFVGINTYNISCARARYDCAHELGHIVLHGRVTPQQESDAALHKVIEAQAHRFAGAFLFPREAFFEEVRTASLDYFCSLKRRWGMSIGAMIYRASDLGLIDEGERGVLFRNLTRRGWRGALREPFDRRDEMPMERPRMLRRGVEVLLSEGFYTRAGLQASLALPDGEIEQLTGLDEGFLQTAEIVQLAVPKFGRHLRTRDLESGEVVEFTKRFDRDR
ncbi:helix-turn-helix domain-containing protein [Methylobacterium sp. J-077]|uniref:helix-turn-helix domain-containing protein n=1 Tax=Methylobacterium sp. J-077 TaxID=2836656 RepID=UPI001FB9A1F9|nr:XRE family transcriptional regulator [Methylobacterium sp. J-077]MCJ2125712.1 XRE family transcriptional regulator [Methylobacterium sp. J-077]